MHSEYKIKAIAFNGPDEPYKGFTIKASFLEEPHQRDALVEVFNNEQRIRRFLFPAYKIWNLAAHFQDIVDNELAGYELAIWDGIEGATVIAPE